MSPILESIGSVKGLGWGSAAIATAFQSIQTVTVGSGGQSTISFSSIPATFSHLQIRATVFSLQTSGDIYYSISPDTTPPSTSFFSHYLNGNGSTVSSSTNDLIRRISANGNAHTTAPFVFIMDILDYSNTNKFKTVKVLRGIDPASFAIQQDVGINSSFVRTTSALNTVTFTISSTGFGQHSTFALYGIKAAA